MIVTPFLVEAKGKRLLYTSDFRAHGRKRQTLDDLTRHEAPKVDALLLEGTMLGREAKELITEEQLERKAIDFMHRCPKAVLVCQSGQNIDRLVSFYCAAVQSDRLFVVDVYIANVLDKLCAARPRCGFPARRRISRS